MAKPFDSTIKELVERNPRPWLGLFLGRDVGAVQVVNSDLSTITAEADKLLRVEGLPSWIIHNEFVASYKTDAPLKAQRYNVLARYRHELPVQSVIVLLRPEADGPKMTGRYEEALPDGTTYHTFLYNVVRVWELPTAGILAGDLATIPLAPISKVTEGELPGLIRKMEERIDREALQDDAEKLWVATYILLGLNHHKDFINNLLQGVTGMRESTTYQAIVEEGIVEGIAKGIAKGRIEEARQTLMRLGRKRFGAPTPATEARIDAMIELEKIERLTDRLLDEDVSNWDKLMVEA